jgi:ADP-ribose pyrophosphatase YjhB (NUDIX family)
VGCGLDLYLNARPTGSVVIVRDGLFLAMRRVREPAAGQWDVPGGFCDGYEHPADTAVREAREELGVEVVLGEFLGMWLGRYHFHGDDFPILDSFWLATIVAGEIVLDLGEASELAWLPLATPPVMAFTTQDHALAAARTLVLAS